MTNPIPILEMTFHPVDVMELVADMTNGPEPTPEEATQWAEAHLNALDECLTYAFQGYVREHWGVRYRVVVHRISLHQGETTEVIHAGNDDTAMYAAVTQVENNLVLSHGTAEIEIIENGRERWIDYQDGKRTDFVEGN